MDKLMNWIKKCNFESIIIKLIVFYLILPFLLFLAGWCRWYIALPGIALLLLAFVRMCREQAKWELWQPEWNSENLKKTAIIVAIVAAWVYLSGIGTLVFQNTDHNCRNAIFELLVEKNWPVKGTITIDGTTSTRGLIYYIGFWLPAAFVGKHTTLNIGYLFQVLWAILGILAFYYLVCAIRKKISVWPLIAFIFFSGLDIVGYHLHGISLNDVSLTKHLEWWTTFQFSSFTTQLFWVFNQALPIWLILLLMYHQKNNRFIIILLGLAMLYGTLPFIGLIPFAAYFIFSRKYGNTVSFSREWWKCWCKDTFSPENIIAGGITGIVSFLYLSGNASGQLIATGTEEMDLRGFLFMYIITALVEFIPYFILIYKKQKTNPLFYIALGTLLICPLIRVGSGQDFCMRASIPALVILFLMVLKTFEEVLAKRTYKILIPLCAVYLIGAVTVQHELLHTISQTMIRYKTGEQIYETSVGEQGILSGDNFSGDVEDSFFYRYLASPK